MKNLSSQSENKNQKSRKEKWTQMLANLRIDKKIVTRHKLVLLLQKVSQKKKT